MSVIIQHGAGVLTAAAGGGPLFFDDFLTDGVLSGQTTDGLTWQTLPGFTSLDVNNSIAEGSASDNNNRFSYVDAGVSDNVIVKSRPIFRGTNSAIFTAFRVQDSNNWLAVETQLFGGFYFGVTKNINGFMSNTRKLTNITPPSKDVLHDLTITISGNQITAEFVSDRGTDSFTQTHNDLLTATGFGLYVFTAGSYINAGSDLLSIEVS